MSQVFREVDQCVTAPQGFRAGSVASGIKSDTTIPDLALLLSDVPCVVAGTFTTSSTRAAPVLLCQDRLRSGSAQAILVNSGNANCATGEQGLRNAYAMTEFVSARFALPNELVLCSSTGIIGRQLPIERIEQGVAAINIDSLGGNAFSEAIMTTDTRPKRRALEFTIDGKTVRLGGVTKGSGMICPNMATMLCYLTTDAAIEQQWLESILKDAVAESFNMIAVDGDMSTNDTCLLFANGLAGNTPLSASHPEAATFQAALRELTQYLAREMARDGEGATKLMIVHVEGGRTTEDARKAARGIVLSPIWQCAVAGGDPNWGRIVAALGASGCELDQATYAIRIGDILVCEHGIQAVYDQEAARQAMVGPEVTISIHLYLGEGKATAWGCDLTQGYIDENTLYTR